MLEYLSCVVDKFVPLKKQGKRSKKKHNTFLNPVQANGGSEDDCAIYKEALNQATAVIRNSKRSYEQNFTFNIKHKCKSFYAYVRSKQKVHDQVGILECTRLRVCLFPCVVSQCVFQRAHGSVFKCVCVCVCVCVRACVRACARFSHSIFTVLSKSISQFVYFFKCIFMTFTNHHHQKVN